MVKIYVKNVCQLITDGGFIRRKIKNKKHNQAFEFATFHYARTR